MDDYTDDGRPKELTQWQLMPFTRRESKISFKFDQHLAIEGKGDYEVRRLKQSKVFTYLVDHDKSQALVVAQDQIE